MLLVPIVPTLMGPLFHKTGYTQTNFEKHRAAPRCPVVGQRGGVKNASAQPGDVSLRDGSTESDLQQGDA